MTLKAHDLGLSHGERWALRGLSCELAPGGRLAVLGRSGAGKTTFLRLLAGLDTPTSGRIEAGGRLLSEAGRVVVPPEERGVGLVFQHLAPWAHLDVEGALRWASRGTQAERRDLARRLADEVGLGSRLDALPSQLSGGEQQRLALARALASEPRLLLLDEPFSHLDRPLRWELGGRLLELLDQRELSLILVTHEHREALELADELLVLEDTHTADAGPAHQLLHSPSHRATVELLELGAVLRATTQGTTATCALGEVETQGEGSALLVRPDQLRLTQEDTGVPGKIVRQVRRITLGTPATLLEVELESGERVFLASEAVEGAEVRLTLQGPCRLLAGAT
jgi:iron(III) transport system ATP-binding protein